MNSRFLVYAACAIAAMSTLVRTQGQPQFRGSTSGVAVHVSVVEGKGTATGLTLKDFVLSDSGVPQTITAVSDAEGPIDLVVVVPDLSATWGAADFKADVADMARVLAPGDGLQVVAYGDGIADVTVGFHRPAVPYQFATCHGLYDALVTVLVPPSSPGRQRIVLALAAYGGSGQVTDLDALKEVAERTSARLFVWMSRLSMREGKGRNGVRASPRCTPTGLDWSTDRQSSLREIAQRQEPNDRWEDLQAVEEKHLNRVATLTGGAALERAVFTGSLTGAVSQVLGLARKGYVLYYTPTGVPEEGWHPIEVKVVRPGRFTVEARPGYAQ